MSKNSFSLASLDSSLKEGAKGKQELPCLPQLTPKKYLVFFWGPREGAKGKRQIPCLPQLTPKKYLVFFWGPREGGGSPKG